MDRNNFDQQQAPPLLETLNGSLFYLYKKKNALPIISMFLEWEKKTSQERLVERCIFITYIQDNTLNIYINHYCVSYTTPNFRLDQFDLKYSHQAETSLCFIPKASAHGSFAGYEIERPQYQRENVCILEKVLEEEAYLEGFC